MLGDLDRRDADAAAAALDEQPLAGFQSAVSFKSEPCSERSGGQRRRLRGGNAIRHRPHFGDFCHGVLGIAAETGITDDALTDAKYADAGAQLGDRSGKLPPWRHRQRVGGYSIRALAQAQVGAIERRRFDFDQNLPGLGFRDGNVFVFKNIFRLAEFVNADGFHRFCLRDD